MLMRRSEPPVDSGEIGEEVWHIVVVVIYIGEYDDPPGVANSVSAHLVYHLGRREI